MIRVHQALTFLLAFASQAFAEIEILGNYPEGLFIDSGNTFFFAEMTSDRVEKVENGYRSTFFFREGCGPTGVTKLDENRFAIACHQEGSVVVLDNAATVVIVVKSSVDGKSLRNPNDINADGLGGAFFSDPGPFSPNAGPVGRVYRLLPDLSVRLVADELIYPNGVAYQKGSRQLYVSEHLAKRISVIQLRSDHTSAAELKTFFDFKVDSNGYDWRGLTGPDGLRILENGDILVAIYGLSRIVFLHGCNRQTWLKVPQKFTTSVGYRAGTVGIAGAFTNARFPFQGMVGMYELSLPSVCDEED